MKPYQKLKALLGVLALFVILSLVMVRAMQATVTTAEAGPDQPYREIDSNAESPTISFIDSPSATCYRPVAGTNACYIEWDYLYVAANSGQYIISMTVAIDNQIRAYHAGFFQSYMYIPVSMTAPGYKVACGPPSSVTGLGSTYAYTIRARETGGLSATNFGSVTCPGDIINLFLPLIQR
ncbi:MAG: hypothetical protein IPM39_14510 [Chloroflexi bacterium]|nr:hypothetical protein [Chloroflexota bacterium]